MASNTRQTRTIRKRKARNAGKDRKRAIRSAVRKAREEKVDVL